LEVYRKSAGETANPHSVTREQGFRHPIGVPCRTKETFLVAARAICERGGNASGARTYGGIQIAKSRKRVASRGLA